MTRMMTWQRSGWKLFWTRVAEPVRAAWRTLSPWKVPRGRASSRTPAMAGKQRQGPNDVRCGSRSHPAVSRDKDITPVMAATSLLPGALSRSYDACCPWPPAEGQRRNESGTSTLRRTFDETIGPRFACVP